MTPVLPGVLAGRDKFLRPFFKQASGNRKRVANQQLLLPVRQVDNLWNVGLRNIHRREF